MFILTSVGSVDSEQMAEFGKLYVSYCNTSGTRGKVIAVWWDLLLTPNFLTYGAKI